MIKRALRIAASCPGDLREFPRFWRPGVAPAYRGVYESYEDALKALPKNALTGFDETSVPDYYVTHSIKWNPCDYPVVYWLGKTLCEDDTVVDLGGGLGQSFYGYQDMLSFPKGVKWMVCEVGTFVERGREMARERGESRLGFTSDWQIASRAHVLLTCGALQYLSEGLAARIKGLAHQPPHVLVNRIPIYDGPAFYTVQSSAHSFSPYRVDNRAAFIQEMTGVGYELVDEWETNRTVRVPFHPENFVPAYRGFYFRLA